MLENLLCVNLSYGKEMAYILWFSPNKWKFPFTIYSIILLHRGYDSDQYILFSPWFTVNEKYFQFSSWKLFLFFSLLLFLGYLWDRQSVRHCIISIATTSVQNFSPNICHHYIPPVPLPKSWHHSVTSLLLQISFRCVRLYPPSY